MRNFFRRFLGIGLVTDSYREYFKLLEEMQNKMVFLEERTSEYERKRVELLVTIENIYMNDAVYNSTLKLNKQELMIIDNIGTIVRTSVNLEKILDIPGDVTDLKLSSVIELCKPDASCILRKLVTKECNIGKHGYIINGRNLRISCSVLKDHHHMVLGKLLLIDDITERESKLDEILTLTTNKEVQQCVEKLKEGIFKKGGLTYG